MLQSICTWENKPSLMYIEMIVLTKKVYNVDSCLPARWHLLFSVFVCIQDSTFCV